MKSLTYTAQTHNWRAIEILLVILLSIIIGVKANSQPVQKKYKSILEWEIDNLIQKSDETSNFLRNSLDVSTPVLNGTAGINPVTDMKLPAYPVLNPVSTTGNNKGTGIRQTIIFDSRGNSRLITTIRL